MALDRPNSPFPEAPEKFATLRQAMEDSRLVPPENFVADACIHYFDATEQSSIQSGWYRIIGTDAMICIYADTLSGVRGIWYSQDMDSLTLENEVSLNSQLEAADAMSILDICQALTQERLEAHQTFADSAIAQSHPFLEQKGVKAYGLRKLGNTLVIPMRDSCRRICGLQIIGTDGTTQFLFDRSSHGCYFSIGSLANVLVVCKDYVTAASIHMATGWSTAAAFRTDNLQPVAMALREKLTQQRILIAGDDEWLDPGNPGLIAAKVAAKSIRTNCVFPQFGNNRPAHANNFNDMHALQGLDAVRTQLFKALEVQDANQ